MTESRETAELEPYQDDNLKPRRGHCFFIKDIELLTKLWECAGCCQRFNNHDNYNRHVTGGTCSGGKTKLICPGEKFERIMNSSEKVFMEDTRISVMPRVSGLKNKAN